MKRTNTSASRTPIRGKGWKKKSTIPTDKYEAISRAIMASLTTTPMAYTRLVERVVERVGAFDGSVSWYTMSCLRELEVQGSVLKHPKPVRYSRKPAAKAV